MTFADTYIPQKFSLPNSLIYHIFHESCDALSKLLLCCKYFYLKYEIIPCALMHRYGKRTKWGYYDEDNYNFIPRLWLLNGNLMLRSFSISQLLPKIYRCDIEIFKLYDDIFLFKDLTLFFSSKKLYYFSCFSTIIYSDGSLVPVETIFEAVPYVKKFAMLSNTKIFPNSAFTKESAEKLAEINHKNKINYFVIHNVPESFNLLSYQKFVKKNHSMDSRFYVGFSIEIKKEVTDKLIPQFKSSLESLVESLKIQNTKLGIYVYRSSDRRIKHQ